MLKDLKSSNTGETINPNIVSENIPSGAVTTEKLNNGAVTTNKLADGGVTTGKLADASITTAKLKDSAVTSGKINDGAVNYDKLATALKNLINGKASQTDLEALQNALTLHTGNTSNPHNVTKAQVGLENVDNTSDANKPISNATQQALNGKASLSGNNNFSGQNTFSGGSRSVRLEAPSDLYFTDSEKDFEDYMGEKQDELISGTNIKTINNESILGSGNINISGGGATLYLHKIYIVLDDDGDNYYIYISPITSTKSTAYTASELFALFGTTYYPATTDTDGCEKVVGCAFNSVTTFTTLSIATQGNIQSAVRNITSITDNVIQL